MDKIIKITAIVFIVIVVVFLSVFAYNVFVENAYRHSLVSTYSYRCSITSDSILTDVTLFIPIPVNSRGNSPIVERFSVREVNGLPPDWKTTLLGSNKGTMVEVRTPVINLVQNGTAGTNYTIELTVNTTSQHLIDTRTPLVNDAMFRPVQDLRTINCADTTIRGAGKATCYNFSTAVYADYNSSPTTRVTIRSEIVGRNEWKIFEPAFNEYRTSINFHIIGAHHGWFASKGSVHTGIGSYDVPGVWI